MQLAPNLLGLPASLLVLIATQLKAQQVPTAIKKMSLDDGEKILPDHMAFAPEYAPAQSPLQARELLTPQELLLLARNSSAQLPFRPPFGVLHSGESQLLWDNAPQWRRAIDVLHRLSGRDFSCPTNTASCESIGQSNYCCATGETCYVVDNPDSGNVGCCPDGQTCGGSVGECGSGSTSCAADVGGGCCISGFKCAQIGCVANSVTAITLTSTSTTVLAGTSPSTVVTTVVVTVSPSSVGQATSTVTSTTTAQTATSTATSTTTTGTGTGLQPYRPDDGSSTTPAPTSTATGDYCPTGFYACLATAGSGCCRTGRDCITTSCPPISYTTITSNGVTLAVPATDVPSTTATSTCAGGWYLCGSDAGPVAGCCPSGYACGTASCTLSTSTATATVQKQLPSAASNQNVGLGKWALVVGVATWIGVALMI